MGIDRKKGMILVTSLLFGTFGLHAIYRAHAKGSGDLAAEDGTGRRTGTNLAQVTPAIPRVLAELTGFAEPKVIEAGDDAISLTAMVDRTAVLRDKDGLVHVEVTIKAKPSPSDVNRVPTDVIVVLDHSGSMTGTKLEYAKQALLGLINRLGPKDRFGVVTFASGAEVLIPLSPASAERAAWKRQVENITVDGGTNIGAGLDLGRSMINYDRDDGATRILLLSDGQDNQGNAVFSELVSRARDIGSRRAVLSTVGIGQDFDENVMTSLATAGTGAFYYVAKLEVLPEMLDTELKTATATYARGAELRIALREGVKVVSAGAIPIDVRADATVIPIGSLYSGRERKLWLTLEVPTNTIAERELGRLSVRYDHGGKTLEGALATLPKIACVASSDAFNKGLVPAVWGRMMLEEELTRTREELGDAIARGTAKDVDGSVERVKRQRGLAEMLGQSQVVQEITTLEERGVQAKISQQAAPEVRNQAAKSEKAIGYGRRNGSMYSGSSWSRGF